MRKKFKVINFVNPEGILGDKEIYNLLVHCILCGFQFPQAHDLICKRGYRITERQYISFGLVIKEQMELDIGCKQEFLYEGGQYQEVDLSKEILGFIELIRESFVQAEFTYLNGSCGHFSKILRNRFQGVPFINEKENHVVTLIGDNFYDITGIVNTGENFKRLKNPRYSNLMK